MNIVLKKAEVLRPKNADTVNEIENRLNDWKEQQRYMEEVGEAPLKDDQKKPLLISKLPVNVMEHLLKSVAMRSDVEGSNEELEKELLEYLAMIDQQIGRQLGTSTPWQTVRITTTKRSQFTSTHSLVETRTNCGCAL